jgi:hypothetical protein
MMKFYVFTTPTGQPQVINCDNYLLAVLNHKKRAKEGDQQSQAWFEALAGAVLIEAENGPQALDRYLSQRQ